MSEFKKPEPPKPPETQFEVPAADFIKAVKGELFTTDNGLYRLKGKEINKKKLFPGAYFNLQDENEYVILQLARVIGSDHLEFLNTELTDYNTGFLFYKSMLPGITLKNTITGVWQLFKGISKNPIFSY